MEVLKQIESSESCVTRCTRRRWRGLESHSRGFACLEHDDGVCRGPTLSAWGLVLSIPLRLSQSILDSSVEEVLSDEETEV